MADNNTASAKTDSTKSDAAKTENLLETRSKEKETLPPSPLHTDHGSTLIAEQVVQKIAGIACREVPGVHAMGSAGRRMLSSITDRIPGSTTNVSHPYCRVFSATNLTIVDEDNIPVFTTTG